MNLFQRYKTANRCWTKLSLLQWTRVRRVTALSCAPGLQTRVILTGIQVLSSPDCATSRYRAAGRGGAPRPPTAPSGPSSMCPIDEYTKTLLSPTVRPQHSSCSCNSSFFYSICCSSGGHLYQMSMSLLAPIFLSL